MGSVNVNRSVNDAFYRYKMPRIQAKVEGKGNGIKTIIVNMVEVAKALGRPATYPTKYFGCELGAQTQFDFKNERFIVNGSHDSTKLQDLLDGFIRKYVLCPACDNPETVLAVTKKGTISQGCKACGHHGELQTKHKLNTYITKNPPEVDPAAQGSSLTKGKRAKKSKRDADGEERSESPENNDKINTSSADVVVEAPAKIADEDDDVSWSVDVSKEAVLARLQDLSDGVKVMTVSEDLDKTEEERMNIFYKQVKVFKEADQITSPETLKKLLNEADRLEVKSKAPLVLAELLFDQQIVSQVKKYRALLLTFVHDDSKAQKYLLKGVEQVIALHKDQLLPKVAGILKLFYDNDILDENLLIDWGSKPGKKSISKEIREKAAPFISWLKTAEEEESETDDDEDDLEIEYDDRARQPGMQQQQQQQQKRPEPVVDDDSEEGDDVDIDAI